jgi:hypothetical protein
LEENPDVNVGTGTVDRTRFGALVDRFVAELREQWGAGHRLDVRENVRFRGGHFSRWVHERYPGRGCALAIEFKKTFMDEWTGVVDEDHVAQLGDALRDTLPVLRRALEEPSLPLERPRCRHRTWRSTTSWPTSRWASTSSWMSRP